MNVENIIATVIIVLVIIIMSVVIPYIKAKIGAEKFEELQKWIKVAVQAAEMIYKETGMGNEKKKYVEDFIDKIGFSIEPIEMNSLIESAVLELKKEL